MTVGIGNIWNPGTLPIGPYAGTGQATQQLQQAAANQLLGWGTGIASVSVTYLGTAAQQELAAAVMRLFPDSGAMKRSLDLLREWLLPEQLIEWDQNESFHVTGSHTGRRYHITKVSSYGVSYRRLGLTMRMCFAPSGASTIGDILLAQKVMLETDEMQAHRIANVGVDYDD